MASSDEEGEIVPSFVTDYHLVNDRNVPTSFSELPLYWIDQENLIENRESSAILRGTTDGGLQPVYREVIGWKLELSDVVPKLYVLTKGKTWIKLQKPRKSYENVIKSVKIVVRCLYFVKRNAEATRDQISRLVAKTMSSYDVIGPVEEYLSAHLPLLQTAVAKDKDLAKSEYLKKFLMEIENPGRNEYHLEENQTKNKSKFIVSDDEEEPDEDFDDDNEDEDEDENEDEDEVIFDHVCAFCDNGGDVLPCEGQCMRSFHPTIDAGVETTCESLGFANAAEYEAIATYLCPNCKHQKHQCFVCGMLGSSDKSSTIEVFPCVSATCGHFYHPACVSKVVHPKNETLAKKLESEIAAGESFTCPVHKCRMCNLGENKDVHELQFAVCRRCPKAYHRKCLPSKIAFEGSDDGTIKQRAWDNLLHNRILMYCLKHPILPELLTPKRDHLTFPCIPQKKNQQGSGRMIERKSKPFGNHESNNILPKVVERPYNNMEKAKSIQTKRPSSSIENKAPISRNPEPSTTVKKASMSRNLEHSTTIVKKAPVSKNPEPSRNMQRGLRFTVKAVKKKIIVDTPPPVVDTDMKTRISRIIKETTSSFDFENFIKEKRRRCSHQVYVPQTGLDKTITMGKVEGSVKAVRAALKKLEEGGSVEDAKAVCEPNILNQLVIWKRKLNIFLGPFLHGARYTSFGRHFTQADKLKEIVDRLHWYVKDGDTIVDFCCGSNDFSLFMKEKLDSTGKTNCLYRNYDVITPKNTFSFERRDWFSVPVDELPNGSRLVMGLNPPFGVQAALANKFINHALAFKPKLIILIVPKETKRLDEKYHPYDLIWEEEDMLSGKSFYLPGSVSVEDKPLDDWNVVSPPLSLWSRRDWTSKHQSIAQKQSHVKPNQNQKPEKNKRRRERRRFSNYLMEEKHDCYENFSPIMPRYPDISTILDDVPEGSESKDTNMASDTTHYGDLSDMELESTPHHHNNTNTSLPYESASGVGMGFQNAFPGHYGQLDFAMHQPPDANYCQFSYPTATLTAPQGPTSFYQTYENICPPGTFPPGGHSFT